MNEPPRPPRDNVIQFPSSQRQTVPHEPELDEEDPFDEFTESAALEYEYYKTFVNPDPPTQRDIKEENERMLQRHRQFRIAADYVAQAFSRFPEVQKVVLFGSVATPLRKEVPRFKQFRKYSVEIYHECGDVDLAVWLTDLGSLKELQRARGRALNLLDVEHNPGVAHHQVDVHIMEPGTDRYLGNLCNFGVCPKGKRECLVPGCGSSLFLQQIPGRKLKKHVFAPERSTVLFERKS